MGDGDHEACNTSLQLGLGRYGYAPTPEMRERDKPLVSLDLSFDIRPKAGMIRSFKVGSSVKTVIDEHEKDRRSSDRADGEITDSKNGARKKLRLTKEQTTLLEDSFKRHSTLNPIQKQALGRLLNLKPRQVEVWFQNRRARTKLKQTEVDFEFLKKWCESLIDENQKLKKELQELKLLGANEASSPLFTQQNPKTSTAMLAICPSCETKVKANDQYPINEAAAKN